MRKEDEAVVLEGRIVAKTAKAMLINFTNNDQEAWIPKSQIYDYHETGIGLYDFHLSEWICKKNGL